MISVLTLTYQRVHLLEEAIQSYLLQTDTTDSEMVIVNDCPDVQYVTAIPNIKIINLNKRFSSVGKKLEFGFKQCKGDYIYRLDDDDLLTPWALELQKEYRNTNPNKEVYRCQKHYFYSHNEYQGLSDSINNGNCYSKEYINRIEFPDKSIGEDNHITFFNNADMHIGDTKRYSMIYRWGMGVYHISGMGDRPNEEIYEITDKSNTESGLIYLQPNFKEDYWSKLPSLIL
jgi:glycosyltransferase involved in cell wall biosynthesis